MLGLALLLLSPLRAETQERVVQTVADFRRYTELHQKRVHLLAQEALRRRPERFPGVTPELLSRYIALHDRNKLTAEFLEPLFTLYGRTIPQLPEAERLRAQSLIDRFNAADQADARALFEAHPEFERVRGALELLEKIADLVDRGSSPLSPEEFGRELEPASRFFKSPDPEDLRLMRELERDYARLTTGTHLRRPEASCLTRSLRAAIN